MIFTEIKFRQFSILKVVNDFRNLKVVMDNLSFDYFRLLSWLPQEKTLLDILKLAFENADYLTVKHLHKIGNFENIISNETEGLREVLQLKEEQTGQIEGFEMQDKDCFAVYGGNASSAVPIYCLELQQKKPNLKVYQKDAIPKAGVMQILAISKIKIALLFADSVEIWSTDFDLHMQQRIALLHPNPRHMATIGFRNDEIFLAVISEIKPNTLHHGAIEIYSSFNGAHFGHLQTVDCIEPQQIAFSNLRQSDDLLLHILTATADQPLLVFQYRGVVGFEQIVGATTLSAAERIQLVELKAAKQHLIALLGKTEITFVEMVQKQI